MSLAPILINNFADSLKPDIKKANVIVAFFLIAYLL